MKKSLFVLFIFCLSFVLIGQGCSRGPSQEKQQAVQPVTLDYWTVFGDTEQLRQFANEFEQRRGYVDINIRNVRYDEFENLFVNALADDVAPDMVSMHVRWLREQRNRLAPMPPRVNVANLTVEGRYRKTRNIELVTQVMPSPSDISRSYIQTVPDNVIINDEIYGLPLAVDTLALYYNKDLLDQAGIAEPPETWQELQEAIQQVTRYNSAGEITQSGIAMGTSNNINNYFDILSALMMQNGIQMAQGQNVTFSQGIDSAGENHPTLQALRFYTDFAREDRDVYSWNEEKDSALDEFIRGNTVFYIGFAHNGEEIRQRAPDMNLETLPLPQLNPSSPVNVANYWVQSVVQKSDNKDEAWSFIRYMSQPDNIRRYVQATQQPTPLRSQIEAQKENLQVRPFLENILTIKNWYKGSNLEAAEQAFNDLIENYKLPYGEDQSPVERDTNLIIDAARRIQQTM